MPPVNRRVETDYDRKQLVRFIENREMPFTVTITDGKSRTNDQNRLQMQWCNDVSVQTGDKFEDVRAQFKLLFGVPILRKDNEAFRDQYDKTVKPLPYETKIDLMKEPIDFPVTRLMTVRQLTAYLDEIWQFYTAKGIILTDPEELRLGARRVA